MMSDSLSRTDREIAEIYERHKMTVYRVCFSYMKNETDTEDAVQETFIRLIKSDKAFENEEHEKAWLIRVAANLCKNTLRHWWRKRENLEDYNNLPGQENIEVDDVFNAVMSMPDKYKTTVYLYYYEGYNSVEISSILKKPQSTIRSHLLEARKILRNILDGESNEEQ